MKLPSNVLCVMDRLESNGFECYAVGGCVRDSLLGLSPADWDLCTNALPENVISIFNDVPCIFTGIQHGTVTVVWDGVPLEITTYRTESTYTDGRHPDAVSFVPSVEEDLSRRDFTVNAVAFHPKRGFVDPFNGRQDLEKGVLRCVGNAEQRFREDALRIIRALRFSACYGFTVEEKTALALETCVSGLANVAAERIRTEWDRLLLGEYAEDVLCRFRPVWLFVFPELEKAVGFDQHSRYHCFDVFTHTVTAVCCSARLVPVRLALLLHDVGKPSCFFQGEDGEGHFYGHAAISEQIAADVLSRLRYDNHTKETVLRLIRYHDTVITADERLIKRWLNRFGTEFLSLLLLVKEGDCFGQIPDLKEDRFRESAEIRRVMEKIIAERQCFSLKDLAINGHDVKSMGFTGKEVGEVLRRTLNAVIDGELPNDKETLLKAIQKNT